MVKYATYWDDGKHCNQIEVFSSLKKASQSFVEEVRIAKKDLAGYFGSKPEEWDETFFYPHIELSDVDDEDECYHETLNCWTPHYQFDLPVEGYELETS